MSARYFILFFFSFFTCIAQASEKIPFKEPFSPKNGWISYGIALIALLVILLTLLKKYKPALRHKSECNIIEKKYLGNKTVVYVFEYQQQRFLLADNQLALALQPLLNEAGNEIV